MPRKRAKLTDNERMITLDGATSGAESATGAPPVEGKTTSDATTTPRPTTTETATATAEAPAGASLGPDPTPVVTRRTPAAKAEDLKVAQLLTRVNSAASETGARAWAMVAPNAPIPLVVPTGLWESMEPNLAVWLGTLDVNMGKWTPWIYGSAMALNFISVSIALAQVRKLQTPKPAPVAQPASPQAPPEANNEPTPAAPAPADMDAFRKAMEQPS